MVIYKLIFKQYGVLSSISSAKNSKKKRITTNNNINSSDCENENESDDDRIHYEKGVGWYHQLYIC